MWKVIFLTGIPASGKSTLAKYLKCSIKPIVVISYSVLLQEYLNVDHFSLREKSAEIINESVIANVDELLISKVNAAKMNSHVVIDSHEITKEEYGYRAKPFTVNQLKMLGIDLIVSLYVEPHKLQDRMEKNAQSRKSLTMFEINSFLQMQYSLALT